MCTVRLRHQDKNAKFRFFAVPEDGLALLGMPGIKVLNILKTTCEVIGDPHESRKLNSQKIEAFNSLSCTTNKALQIKIDEVDRNDNNANISDYLKSTINRVADKKGGEILTKYVMKSVMFPFRIRLL